MKGRIDYFLLISNGKHSVVVALTNLSKASGDEIDESTPSMQELYDFLHTFCEL